MELLSELSQVHRLSTGPLQLKSAKLRGVHFIAGLPRSGSTLLVALLRQNPEAVANITSPLLSMLKSLQAAASVEAEFSNSLSDDAIRNCLRGAVTGYLGSFGEQKLYFDTNRMWPSSIPLMNEVFEDFGIVCCVRRPSEVFASFERIFIENPLRISRLYSESDRQTIFGRFDSMFKSSGVIGAAIQSLEEALHGDFRNRVLLIEYHQLVHDPLTTMAEIYEFLRIPGFLHNFDDVEFSRDDVDAVLGARGLHTVPRGVRALNRELKIPKTLTERADSTICW